MASEISRIETGGVSRPIKDETARNDNLILHQQKSCDRICVRDCKIL